MSHKSTPAEIRARFDADVERFSNLETGQTATVDAALALELVARAAAVSTPHAKSVLDLGCGAGNFTLKLLEHLPALSCTLVDLSLPMLARARERVAAVTSSSVETLQGDLRELGLGTARHDIILAAAVLHHLREEHEWRAVFARLYAALRPGGTLWIFDLVAHEIPAVQDLLWESYGAYLSALKDDSYRDRVFAYINREDSPRPLTFQSELLRAAGFAQVDILHKNSCFAAFGARKALDDNLLRPVRI
ncbi:MAG: class I SAM-dependent methyltransferase [Acidobacteriota bacterium]|nr:class I SAM-dependent methyltransferase [Acidobacteriota bacterium]